MQWFDGVKLDSGTLAYLIMLRYTRQERWSIAINIAVIYNVINNSVQRKRHWITVCPGAQNDRNALNGKDRLGVTRANDIPVHACKLVMPAKSSLYYQT